eukprot:87027-Ditylum_brightwellii.AAC.1
MEVHAPAFMPRLQPLRFPLGNLNHKGGHIKGYPPQTGVVQKGAKRECHLWFWRGRALAGSTHREGKHNM